MLYTRRGDDGTTYTCSGTPKDRVSKCSRAIEALGSVDEVNSLLGLCKARISQETSLPDEGQEIRDIIHNIQENLFIVQAEIAGAGKSIKAEKVEEIEAITDRIEREVPPIKSFFIAGETEISALLDLARAVSRRTERRVIEAVEHNEITVSQSTKKYLNRVSSVLYALVRLANMKLGAVERSPTYK